MVSDYARAWLVKAMGDLAVVRHELRLAGEEMVSDAVCFHAQQTIEKPLKVYLAEQEVDFPKTHSLEMLLTSCMARDPSFAELPVGQLTDFAVQLRYPDEFFEPRWSEIAEASRLAEAAARFVLSKLQLTEGDLRKEHARTEPDDRQREAGKDTPR